MSRRRLTIRLFAIIFAVALSGLLGVGDADAGCLNRLYGRPPATAAAVPYTPVITQSPAYPVTAVPTMAPTTAATSGVVQAQRPAYGTPVLTTVQTFENPSVYTGLPVGTPSQYSAQRLPITSSALPTTTVLRANTAVLATPVPIQTAWVPPPAPASNWSGAPIGLSSTAANRVPIAATLRGNAMVNPITAAPVYTANYPTAVAPVTYNAPAQTVGTQVVPQQQTFGSGLSRFFNSSLGNNTSYSTSYNQTPITYYRPITSVNPVTGTTVTVQQPCSSYVQQLQRVPYNTFLQPTAVAPVQQTVPVQSNPGVCSSPMTGGSYPQTSFPVTGTPAISAPGTFAPGTIAPPSGGIGQVGGQLLPGSATVTPIPSTAPLGGSFGSGAPNTAPLTGGSMSEPSGGTIAPSDQQNVPQPRLESGRPTLSEPKEPTPLTNGSSEYYFKDFHGDDVYPYGSAKPKESEKSQSEKPEAENPPAIQLDPPVAGQMRGSDPSVLFRREEQFTMKTPPSLESSQATPDAINQQYSTLRPIGVPTDADGNTPPISDTAPNDATSNASAVNPAPVNSSDTFDRPNTDTLEPPPLPVPGGRAADASSLFRNTESSASVRYPSQVRVTVPVREATTRHQSVRQVAAWEEIRQSPAPRRQVVPQRDTGGWLPTR